MKTLKKIFWWLSIVLPLFALIKWIFRGIWKGIKGICYGITWPFRKVYGKIFHRSWYKKFKNANRKKLRKWYIEESCLHYGDRMVDTFRLAHHFGMSIPQACEIHDIIFQPRPGREVVNKADWWSGEYEHFSRYASRGDDWERTLVFWYWEFVKPSL